MFTRLRLAALALSLFPALSLAPPAQASTVGLPILVTEPGTLSFVNLFRFGLPTDRFQMSYSGFIATAEGAAELIGTSIDFTWFSGGGLSDGITITRLVIDGFDLQADNGLGDPYQIRISPPVDSSLTPYTYLAPFTGFGPYAGVFPERDLLMSFSGTIPTKTGYLYCPVAGPGDCEFSNLPGLTVIDGKKVEVVETREYPEGTLRSATVTFSTIDGRVPPIPLPATGVLLGLALAGLAIARRRAAV